MRSKNPDVEKQLKGKRQTRRKPADGKGKNATSTHNDQMVKGKLTLKTLKWTFTNQVTQVTLLPSSKNR